MDRYEILDAIFDLVSASGSYMLVYNEIRKSDDLLIELEKQDFNNIDDLIEYLEAFYL